MSRVLWFVYGVLAYVAGCAALVGFIAFVADLPLPKTVDRGIAGPYALLVDLALVAAFGLVHSGMARPGFKRVWTRFMPPHAERSTYVLVAGVQLLVLMVWWQPLPAVLWSVESLPLRVSLYALCAFGWILLFASTFMIDHFELFGLKQVYAWLRRRTLTPGTFRLTILYALVRHPIMLGMLIGLWATPTMTVGHAMLAGFMTVYILIGIHFEERDLVAKHGDAYRRYQREVPRLVPRARPVDARVLEAKHP